MSTATMLVPMNGDGHGHGNAIQTSRPVVGHLTVDHVKAAMENIMSIRTYVAEQLSDGKDYGIIPGTGRKDKDGNEVGTKVLLKPGAEQIALLLDCRFQHEIERVELGAGHMEVSVKTLLISRSTDNVVAEGFGMCSTMEAKYRYRNGKLVCPKCGKEQVNKSKDKPEYYCWAKMGGCGATFREKDPSITGQVVGKVENDDIYSARNTVLKMAKKRADVDATLTAAALSGEFTQDLEEIHDIRATPPPPARDVPAEPAPAPASAPVQIKSSPGSEFVAFLGDESRRIGRDLVKSASSYGQRKQYPANLHDWTEEQASACWGWIERGLAKKADEAAAKTSAPADTAEAQRDESKAEIEQAYRPGPVRQRFEDWIVEAMDEANAWWREADIRISAGLPDEKLVSSRYHLSNHLGKWAETVPEFKYVRPDPFLPGPVMDRLAPIWERNRQAFLDETHGYLYTDLPAKVVAEAAAKAEKRAAKSRPQAEPGANG